MWIFFVKLGQWFVDTINFLIDKTTFTFGVYGLETNLIQILFFVMFLYLCLKFLIFRH